MIVTVVGCGVVGSAVLEGFDKLGRGRHKFLGYDKYKPEFPWQREMEFSDLVILCLPTPTDKVTWKQDISSTHDFLSFWKEKTGDKQTELMVKSTVLPGTIKALRKQYGLNLTHNPEFLTEANAKTDFLNQADIYLGGETAENSVGLYADLFPKARLHLSLDPTTTEMMKYAHNCFLAMKVGFFNEISELCEKVGTSYAEVRKCVGSMPKIGLGHTAVPGPDNGVGFAGMCFGKDTRALAHLAEELGMGKDTLLHTTMLENIKRRPEC